MRHSLADRRLLIIWAVLAVGGMCDLAQADLLGYWPLDGNAQAIVGINGSTQGKPTPTHDRLGNPRGAMAFDGAKRQSVAILGGSGLNGLTSGSICLWVRWDADNQDAGAGDAVFGAVLGRQKNGQWSSNLLGLAGPDPSRACVRWRADLRDGGPLDGKTPVGLGQWRHLAVTFSAGESRLYLDGRIEAVGKQTNPLEADLLCPLSVGAWTGDGDSHATASLDDLAIWNHVLTPEEIASLADARATPATVSPPSPSLSPLPSLRRAAWIWSARQAIHLGTPLCLFRKTFDLSEQPSRATILITVDNSYDLYVNGAFVAGDDDWRSVERYDITEHLAPGHNVISVFGRCFGQAAGLLAAVRIESDGQDVATELATDATWRMRLTPEPGWTEVDHDDSAWPPVAVLGPPGVGVWGRIAFPGMETGAGRTTPVLAEADDDFTWPEGIVFVRGFVPVVGTGFGIVRIGESRAYTELDSPSPAALGRQLYSLVPARPDGLPRLLHDAGQGVLGSPSVSFDGETVYFSMALEGEKFFHVYRIARDGTDLKPLTDGPWHDYDPQPLGDGRVVFSSTRIGSRDEYHGNVASSLFTLDSASGDIRPLTHHIVGDHEAKLTAGGSLVFIRRDNFLERAKVETRIQHTRPDGTGGTVLLGADRRAIGYDRSLAAENNSAWLRIYGFGSPAPLADGRVAAISTAGLVVSGTFDSGSHAMERIPLACTPFDISPLPDGRLLYTAPGRGWIGLLDLHSPRPIFLHAMDDVHSVVYLGRRPRPPGMATAGVPSSNPGESTGYLLCQDVFHSKQKNADWARVKAVRVYEGRPFTLRSAHHGLVHLGVEAIELGVVPLAPDGSFYVRVPADRALALQAVDAAGRGVVNEMSWIYVRPGERRTCVGCHAPRSSSPLASGTAMAARARPLSLLGQGDPHRYRANNAANGGVLNLQLDRFREVANINLARQEPLLAGETDEPLPPGRAADVDRLLRVTSDGTPDERVAALGRLAVFRDRRAVSVAIDGLSGQTPELRVSAAITLAACGDRRAVQPLLRLLDDEHPLVAQAANVALERLVGHSVEFRPFAEDPLLRGGSRWRAWLDVNDWSALQTRLVARLDSEDPIAVHQAVEALGHIGGEAARVALRSFLMDRSDGDLRTSMAAMRSLGHLRDEAAVDLLADVLYRNAVAEPPAALDLHELGWRQKPGYLAATAAEALGRIGGQEAEDALLESFSRLRPFWDYTFNNGDHDWLRGCHASVVHFRILEALDAIGTCDLRPVIPDILRSLPIDPDRALLFENDGYETLVARLVQRSGMTEEVLETCLAVLGDAEAESFDPLLDAVTASPPATEVKPQDAQTRAAQLLSVVVLDDRCAARVRAALGRYRALAPSRTRSWVCFFLARALGKVRDGDSVDALIDVLLTDAAEASLGLEDPPNVFIYKAMTPFHRAAAAYALGEIGDTAATDTLLSIVADFDNAASVRHAAAQALGKLVDGESLARLQRLADNYPEIATGRALRESCRQATRRGATP